MGESQFFFFFFLPWGSTYFHITCNSNSFLWKLKQLNAWEKKNMFESFVGILRNLRIGGKIKRNMFGMMFIAICFFFSLKANEKKMIKMEIF